MALTNPCDGCDKNVSGDCRYYDRCNRYRYWLNYNWKCARIAAKGKRREKPVATKWVYNHPDVNRKYINEGVCAKCPLNGNCDEPCGDYWDWWDARMEYFRKVAGMDV